MSLLPATDVADRLGVKLTTVYAYVSRGHLTRHTKAGSSRSWFDSREVDLLVKRGRPRRTSRPAALDFTIETGLTTIDGHELRFRGKNVLELARTCSFEEVAEWLWRGDAATTDLLDAPAALPWEVVPLAIPDVPTNRDALRLAVVLASASDPLRADTDPAAITERARSLIATMAAAVTLDRSTSRTTPPPRRTARLTLPDRAQAIRGTIAGRLWGGLTAQRSAPAAVATLNAALILLADHELAVSTLAARIAASARADPYSVVLAGLGPLAGPLHGAASRHAYDLIAAATAHGPEAAIAQALESFGRIPGFGHHVYATGDPRARVLINLTRTAYPQHPTLDLSDRLITIVQHRAKVEPNIDFALAMFTNAAGMAAAAGETIFTIARTAGWIAHAIEEVSEMPLRFRARAVPRREIPS